MVECRVTFSDGREITKSVPLSGEDGDCLARLSKGLLLLKEEINYLLTEQVDKEKVLLAKGGQKRLSSNEDEGENT